MGSVFAATNLVTLSEHSGIRYGVLRGVFSRDNRNFYREEDYEVWRVDSSDIYAGKPRGKGFS